MHPRYMPALLVRRAMILLMIVGSALVVSSCSQSDGSPAQKPGAGGGRKERIVPVAAAAAEKRELAHRIVVAAPVEAVRTVGVNGQANGSITSLRVREGDYVRAGQLLAQLDARESSAQLERARAALAKAKATYERTKQLNEKNLATAAELEQALTDRDVAESDVKLWQTRVGFSRITAPISGVITARHVETGSTVQPNQRLFDIADVSLLVVQVRVSELDVVHMKQGEQVKVTLDAFPADTIGGTIRRIFPSADAASRLVPVEIALGRRPASVSIKPGYLARVHFATDSRAAALVVPASAIGAGEKGAYVYVIGGDTLARRDVTVGMTADTWVEVVEGLQYGERVVSSGHSGLRPGTKVRVTEGVGAEATQTALKGGANRGGAAQ